MLHHQPRHDVWLSRPNPNLSISDLSGEMGGAPVNIAGLSGTLARAIARHGMAARSDGRYQADGMVARPGALDLYRRRHDAAVIDQLRRDGIRPSEEMIEEMRRADADGYISGGVGGFPRDFEFVRQKIYEEERQPLSAMEHFPIDTSVPLGARSHTVRRRLGSGTARIVRGGDSFIPRAGSLYKEQSFGVAYIVCGAGQNFFEELTQSFANMNSHQHDLSEARRLVDERINEIYWFGDQASNLPGILTYPDLAKTILPLAYDEDAAGFGTTYTKKDLVVQLQDLGSTPRIRSGTKFKPNRLLVSPAMMSFLTSRKHEDNGGTDSSMLKYFIENNSLQIREIGEAPELSGIGPDGEDGVLFYADNADAVQLQMIQAPTPLPVYQASPLDQVTVIYAAVGGTIMINHGNNILGYARVKDF